MKLALGLLTTSLALGSLTPDAHAGPIQDNSFLIEEAYNQEPGVVQHINTFQRTRHSGDWQYTFTQEWPLSSQAHQASYTVPLTRLNGGTGLGDVALNYRYQWIGSGETALAVSPRLTLLLPTGNWRQGRGSGATGVQAQLPASLVLVDDTLVAHTNLGFTHTPRARNALGERASVDALNFGQSLVWLLRPNLNLMLEWAWQRTQAVAAPGATETSRSSIVSPGLRWAYDLDSGLQIVPGIAFPTGVGPSRGQHGVFLYLSFEHPFGRQ